MKRLLVIAAMIALVTAFGCAKKEKVELESVSQKVSYSIGLQVAQSLESLPVEFNKAAFVAALDDSLGGKEPRLSKEEMTAVFGELQAEARKKAQSAAQENLARGKAFLAENAKKEGVTVTKSGLQYIVLTQGKGRKPRAKDTVVVHYKGSTLDGKIFDNSYERGVPNTWAVTRVVAGWTEALQLMPVGSKYKLFIPSNIAYGPRGNRGIGPNETLIFEVELISIKK